jgi:Putative Actinobacterial Holin-X, holin superfamily III
LPADPDQNRPQQIGHTVAEISEKASLLVREEIALAKAEVTQKATRLGKGAATAAAAGVFALFGFIMFLHFLAWMLADLFLDDRAFWGYLTVSVFLFLLAGIAAFIGIRWIKKGAPPTPDMAIEEAKAIRETVSNA